MQLLTLINLPFSLLGGCVREGGSERVCVCVCVDGVTVIIYAHGCTPINCKEGKTSSIPVLPVVAPCKPKSHDFKEVGGAWGRLMSV